MEIFVPVLIAICLVSMLFWIYWSGIKKHDYAKVTIDGHDMYMPLVDAISFMGDMKEYMHDYSVEIVRLTNLEFDSLSDLGNF